MRAGTLNCRVKLQALVDVVGESELTSEWSDIATVWADIRFKSGLEALGGDAPVSVVKASIRIRFRDDVEAGMRALHGATGYKIQAVLPDLARREFVDLVCEVAND